MSSSSSSSSSQTSSQGSNEDLSFRKWGGRTSSLSNQSIHSSSSSSGSSSTNGASHDFIARNFTTPTYCDYCNGFLWGLLKQGANCTSCGYTVHSKCLGSIRSPCCPSDSSSTTSGISSRSGSSSNLSGMTITSEKDLVTELFAETHAQSKKLGTAYDDVNPTLTVSLFVMNNQRFISRQLPLIYLSEKLIKLVTWDSTPHTLIFLLCYTLLCLKPFFFAILPQILILYLMAKFYHTRADCLMRGKPLPKPHTIGDRPRVVLSFSENKAALQNIQNLVGFISDIYDLGFNVYKMLDWSNPDLSKSVLIQVILSVFAVSIVVVLIPVNILFLLAGVGLFVANTAIVKAMVSTLAPIAIRIVKCKVAEVIAKVKQA